MLEFWPQIAWIALISCAVVATAAKHGDTVQVNIGYRLISVSISAFLLYMGGFFS